MTKKEYLLAVKKCLEALFKNAPHCFNIDFMALNSALMETDKQLKDLEAENEPDAHSN